VRHFEVEWHAELRPKPVNVMVLDMPPILPKVRRDPVSTGFHRRMRGKYGVGFVGPARLPYRGDVVDVDV
jgi:hypothetical protein